MNDRRAYVEARRESLLRSGCLGTRYRQPLSEACLLSTGKTIPNPGEALELLLKAVFGIWLTAHLRFVDVIVVPFVRTADQHDDEIVSFIQSLVPDRRLKEISVLLEPLWDIDRR